MKIEHIYSIFWMWPKELFFMAEDASLLIKCEPSKRDILG